MSTRGLCRSQSGGQLGTVAGDPAHLRSAAGGRGSEEGRRLRAAGLEQRLCLLGSWARGWMLGLHFTSRLEMGVSALMLGAQLSSGEARP